MDFWSVLLFIAGFFGIMGWFFTIPLTACLLWYCNWREGVDVDWGTEIGFTLATPFAYIFAIFEIVVLFSK